MEATRDATIAVWVNDEEVTLTVAQGETITLPDHLSEAAALTQLLTDHQLIATRPADRTPAVEPPPAAGEKSTPSSKPRRGSRSS